MAYDDDLERDFLQRIHQWRDARWSREFHERWLMPDERLDEVGWEIFYCAIAKGMDSIRAARLAMDGNYRQRRRVAEDFWERHDIAIRRRLEELQPARANFAAFNTHAPEQLEFWKARLEVSSFVYFIQDGDRGPVKIGLSTDPERRMPQLQTGNPRSLQLRHVIPGDLSVESALHQRFAPARIRGEWFGREYLPIILAFAGGLADRMVGSYDGSGVPRLITGAEVRTEAEIARIRRDIEHRWLHGFTDPQQISELLWVDVEEVEDHLVEMSESTAWDIPEWVGDRIQDDRLWAQGEDVWLAHHHRALGLR